MTDQMPHTSLTPQPRKPSDPPQHGGHGLLMIACCIPMLVIVGILVITGVAGSGAIIYAVLCTAMMALMMFAMPGGHRH